MIKKIQIVLLCLSLGILSACSSEKGDENPNKRYLPIFGKRVATKDTVINGTNLKDTVFQTVPNFLFINLDGKIISEKSVQGKIYVANFFFTSCPTICPTTQRNLLKVQEAMNDRKDFRIISHTVDPTNDTIPALLDYALKLGADTSFWYFVRGDEEYTYGFAESSYFAMATKDASAPGGYAHSGAFVLVDKERRVRGMYDGTDIHSVYRLIKELRLLYKEYGVEIIDSNDKTRR